MTRGPTVVRDGNPGSKIFPLSALFIVYGPYEGHDPVSTGETRLYSYFRPRLSHPRYLSRLVSHWSWTESTNVLGRPPTLPLSYSPTLYPLLPFPATEQVHPLLPRSWVSLPPTSKTHLLSPPRDHPYLYSLFPWLTLGLMHPDSRT